LYALSEVLDVIAERVQTSGCTSNVGANRDEKFADWNRN
jgi:hypothetical protein